MAWSLVSSNNVDSGSTTQTSFTVTLPGHAAGDVILISLYKDQDLGDWTTSTSGWALLSSNRASTGRDRSTAIFYKVANSASESSPVIVYSNASNDEYSITTHVFRSTIGTLSNTYVINDWNYDSNQNVQNPIPPSVITSVDNQCVVTFQMQTHDDNTAAVAPPGYTLGETIIGSVKDNRQQLIAYNLDVGTAGLQSIGAWSSTWNNSVSEYSTYTIALIEDPLISITNQGTEQLDNNDLNKIVTGFGFETTQGTGKLELADSTTYATATKTIQMIDSWSATSIQFDPVFTNLSEGSLWLFVTNNNGDVSIGYFINYGLLSYAQTVKNLSPDYFHRFNNDFFDSISTLHATQAQVGPPVFTTDKLVRGSTHSMSVTTNTWRTEVPDSAFTNVTNLHQRRYVGGWFQVDSLQQTPSAIWEEGGGVNNFYFVLGFGNILLANVANSSVNPAFKIQAFSDFKLAVNRPYHIMFKFEGSNYDNEFRLFIDGILQSKTSGNPVNGESMSLHSGDQAYGKPDGNLDTGGTDIAYNSITNGLWSHWCSFTGSETNGGGGAPLTAVEIRRDLFEMGVLPVITIPSATTLLMQTTFEIYNSTVRADAPLAFLVNIPTDSTDLTLTATDMVFDDKISIHLQWVGAGILTIINTGTSNILASKCSVIGSGSIIVINAIPIMFTCKDIDDNTTIPNVRVLIEAAPGGDLAIGTDIISGTTNGSGLITGILNYTSDQPVIGKFRSNSGVPYYKQQNFTGTITSGGLTNVILMIKDE